MVPRTPPETYEEVVELFPDVSGNDVNGLGETKIRRPSPFFWHPKDRHEFGKLQTEVIAIQRRSPAIVEHYSENAPRGPKIIEKSETLQHHAKINIDHLNVEIIFECKLILFFSNALSISLTFKNIPTGFPSAFLD